MEIGKYQCSFLDCNEIIGGNFRIYGKVVSDRKKRLDIPYHGDLSKVLPLNGNSETYLWNFYPPAWNFIWRERLGRFFQGGKVICNPDIIRTIENPIVYSYGVRNDVSFEENLISRTNVSVYAFDPNVDSLPSQKFNDRIQFYQISLGQETAHGMESLDHAMNRNHARIDLLKIDFEGCEWAVFKTQKAQQALHKVDLLLMELYLARGTQTLQAKV